MNKLIIIGNGFDLANNLKTSYEDFLLIYLKGKILEVISSTNPYSDKLLDISYNRLNLNYNLTDEIQKLEKIDDIRSDINIFWKNGSKALTKYGCSVTIEVKSNFFANLISQKENWTNIESAYFRALLDTKDNQGNYDRSKYLDLNDEFDVIKKELSIYIKHIDCQFTQDSKSLDIFKLPKGNFFIYKLLERIDEIETRFELSETESKVLFVNFNYTNTIQEYFWKAKGMREISNCLIVDIHGNCKSEDIIFGYGDESHQSYQELEDENDNDLLKNMKSFYYGFSDAYEKIMSFMSEDFSVEIVGHSLGLSDRLLFREIFENDKCKKIKLYHRGDKNSYFNKRIALSRHFKDNTNMRNKVVSFSKDDIFS